ncbi:hypothetical protein KIPB_011670 [Kipferlia bialata]|uniref:Uncharacterized protein n=1 Tax=Kipferlia bialata TaxID=797122 RepID=A0A9K3GNX9_9EUKA|nr:hypothetical protein KIPB_011670 [Kipferlia bialata]|eukprot:g11670.t1
MVAAGPAYAHSRAELERTVAYLAPGRNPDYKFSNEQRRRFISAFFYTEVLHEEAVAARDGHQGHVYPIEEGFVLPICLMPFFDTTPLDYHAGPVRPTPQDYKRLQCLFNVINEEANILETEYMDRGLPRTQKLDAHDEKGVWHATKMFLWYQTDARMEPTLRRLGVIRIGWEMYREELENLNIRKRAYKKWSANVHIPTHCVQNPPAAVLIPAASTMEEVLRMDDERIMVEEQRRIDEERRRRRMDEKEQRLEERERELREMEREKEQRLVERERELREREKKLKREREKELERQRVSEVPRKRGSEDDTPGNEISPLAKRLAQPPGTGSIK